MFCNVDSQGRVYDRFYPRRSIENGPGWFVFGRNPGYGDTLIRLCAQPDVKPRRTKYYNGKVQRGYVTRREAQQVADKLNADRR